MVGVLNREAADFGNVLPLDAYIQGLAPQTSPVAFGAKGITPIAAEEHAHVQLVLLALQVGKESANAFEIPVSLKQPLALFYGQLVVRNIGGDFSGTGSLPHLGLVGAMAGFRPGLHRALGQRLVFIGNHQVEIKINGVSEPLAARASSVGVVE